MRAWWELIEDPGPGAETAIGERDRLKRLPEAARWSDYQWAFDVSGGRLDGINLLHRLAFERFFTPAWEAVPSPMVAHLTSRQAVDYALTCWRRGWPAGPGPLVPLPSSLQSRPLPFVAPDLEGRPDAPVALALLSGAARWAPNRPVAPWWTPGCVLDLGQPVQASLDVDGPYALCLLMAGRGILWEAEGGGGHGCDTIQFSRTRHGFRFTVKSRAVRRLGSLQTVQMRPHCRGSRRLRLRHLVVPRGGQVSTWSDDDAEAFVVRNAGRAPVGARLELETGTIDRFASQRFPGLRLEPGKELVVWPRRGPSLLVLPVPQDVDPGQAGVQFDEPPLGIGEIHRAV